MMEFEHDLAELLDGPANLTAALAYADVGVHVFPCAGKIPLTPHGVKDATSEAATIREWWTRWPDANIAAATGISGFFAIDADGEEGINSIRELAVEHELPSTTPKQKTGGGGYHYLYKCNGHAVRNSTRQLGAGLDIRGNAGYIILPPSEHESGRRYEWVPGCSIFDVELADPPESLLDIVTKSKSEREASARPKARRQHANGDYTSYVQAALDNACAAVSNAPDGAQEETLNSGAFSIGTLVGSGVLSFEAAKTALVSAGLSMSSYNTRRPWVQSEIRRKVERSLRDGMQHPRVLPRQEYAQGRIHPEPEGEWGSVKPLPPVRPIAPSLPDHMIPEPLRAWVRDVSERASVARDYVLVPAIIGLGAIVGRQVGICPKRHDDWVVVPNNWGAIVGRPGVMKSYSVQQGLSPLTRLEARERARFKEGQALHKAECEQADIEYDTAKAELKAATKNANSQEIGIAKDRLVAAARNVEDMQTVSMRRYKVNDTTVEKLGVVHAANPRGLVVERDELTGLLRSLDKHGREGDREFYLESWTGLEGKTVERISRDDVHLDALCLSLIGGMQPGKLDSYVNPAIDGGNVHDDGLIQRFQLIVWPEQPGDFVDTDRRPDREAEQRVQAIFEALDDIDVEAIGANTETRIPTLRFDDAAQSVFREWRTELENRLRADELDGQPAFESHLAKYRSLMPSLALIFHLVDVAAGSVPGPVPDLPARLAAAWCEFLEAHARKVYARECNRPVAAAHALWEKILRGDVEDGMRVREIYRKGWSGLTPTSARDALTVLEHCNVARVVNAPTEGRNQEIVRLNPEVL